MNGGIWAILGAVFGAGGAWATMRAQIAKARSDVNGIGINLRRLDRRIERRNKQLIAALIDRAQSLEEAKKFAAVLREDSWEE